ncbi:hypothetical protein AALP_AA1G226600 [Arabis alpina]|uniref:Uncharacterized protein n=1 Tax=Arabis alpina TaxID=50452 RepID=A0A087HPZ0_ARAAL|nr:hypothetical protein AALP_AA1G226600 [Arabis alpina]
MSNLVDMDYISRHGYELSHGCKKLTVTDVGFSLNCLNQNQTSHSIFLSSWC